MPRIKELDKINRPREKLAKYGPSRLSNAELLAILLRTGTKQMNVVELSKKIFRKYPKQTLVDARIDDLKNISGLGTAKSCEIVACIELGRRLLKDKKSQLILSAKDVWEAMKDIRGSKKEHFVVFFLDSRNQEIRREIVSIGTLNASLIHPREVFEQAIIHSAAHIIVAHNHPSGDTTPSQDDIEITRNLECAGKILDIRIIDHVIVTKKEYMSIIKN